MTATLERPSATVRGRAVHPRRGRHGRWRVPARLARRQVRRTALSSALIAVLILLPIAAMTAYTVVAASSLATPDERARAELGLMQAWVAPGGAPDRGLWQAPTEPGFTGYPPEEGGGWTIPDAPAPEDPIAALPPGTEVIRLIEGSAPVETADGVAMLRAWAGEAWDPRFAGRFDLIDGERPSAQGEAAITEAALTRLDVALGDEVAVAGARSFRIVGVLEAAELADGEAALFLPESADDVVRGEERWYLPERVLDWPDVQELNAEGVVALSRAVLAEAPTDGPAAEVWGPSTGWQTLLSTYTILIVGGIFMAYVVVMLAGAAFAVAARRQQRSLAVAASLGADRRDLFRTIVLQGTALGAIGGTLGVAVGVGAAAGVMAATADGSATQYWGFHVPWAALVGILIFAVVVGTLAALVPARTVARTDALHALRGARRPQVPRGSRPVWGLILLVLGVSLTIVSALVWLAASSIPSTGPFSPVHVLPPYGIIAGPILVQIGILLSGRWLLWVLSLGMSRAGTAARIAARDAAANAGRTVPAFAAIAATVFIGVFAFGQSAMQSAQSARTWYYAAPVGSLAIDVWPGPAAAGLLPPDGSSSAFDLVETLARDAGAQEVAIIDVQTSAWGYPDASAVPDDLTFTMAILPEEHLLDPEVQDSYRSWGQDPGNPLSIVAPDDVGTALGIQLSPAERAAYRDGAALVADPRFVTDGTIDIGTWPARLAWEGGLPDNVWLPFPGQREPAEPDERERMEAIVVDTPLQPIAIAISPASAERLGMTTQPQRGVATFAQRPSVADLDRINAQAQLLSTPDITVNARLEDGPPSQVAWMAPLLGAVSVLVLGASGVALGLARFERRPDDATLSAVGGTRGLRRRIAFWQGLIVAGFGTIAGVAAGILPPIGFAIQSSGTLRLADIPWWLLACLAFGLPLVVAIVNALVPPRHPDLTRRTAIA